MNQSETVQAAQRLLAERERFGLAKYGTTVDRTDLHAGDWLQHAIEEASDLLLYLIRLKQMMPGTPDSDLPTLSSLAGIAPDLISIEEQDDAERAAYLERWREAPEWAEWLSEDGDGDCAWWEREPFMNDPVNLRIWNLYTGKAALANRCLLGSVRCELRPRQGEGL